MTAFAIGVDSQFEDPNLARDADWLDGGAGTPVPVRVILRAPDGVASFGDRRFVVETVLIRVRTSQVPLLREGDRFDVEGAVYEVQGAPSRDALRLVWTAEARPVVAA